MARVRVKASFSLFLPLESERNEFGSLTLTSKPQFGFTTAHPFGEIKYSLRLFYKQRITVTQEYEQQDCLCWATKTPLCLTDEQQQSGLLLRLKVKQGVFDFRKVEKIFIRLQIECSTSEGQIINTATSGFFQLLPRKRKSDIFDGNSKGGQYIILKNNFGLL